MLAGGKEVNYLMINGDVFRKDLKLPRFYRYDASSVTEGSCYKFVLDNNNKISFVIDEQRKNLYIKLGFYIQPIASNIVPVFQIVKYEQENYALTYGATYQRGSGGGGIDIVWAKMSEFGKWTPLDKVE